VQALPSANAAAGGYLERTIDEIGLGRFHVLLLFCVSLIWAGEAQQRCCQHSSSSSSMSVTAHQLARQHGLLLVHTVTMAKPSA
jgi:hypothetical protein